jgi:hypothetical protein
MEQATFEQRLAALLVLGFDLHALETDGATSVRITKGHRYAVGRHPSVLEALARAVTAWEKLHADEGMGLVALLNDPTETQTDHGTLIDYQTGDDIRPATVSEREASDEAGPEGVIIVGGRSCYVVKELI